MKSKLVLSFAAALVVAVCGFYLLRHLYQADQSKQLTEISQQNSQVFERFHSPRYGDTSAKVVLTEFLDPECESCRRFYPFVKELLEEFKGQVQLVVRYAPFHKNSEFAIRAVEAARVQGKYWEGLELLFKYQPEWGDHHNPQPERIFEYLPSLGLNMDQLKEDMKDPKIEAILKQDLEDLKALEVRGTPSFFVNGRRLFNFSRDGLRALLVDEIEVSYSSK